MTIMPKYHLLKGDIMRRTILAVLILFLMQPLWGQSNEVLDKFLSQDRADLETSLWLILLASENLPSDASPQDVYPVLSSYSSTAHLDMSGLNNTVSFGEFAYAAMDIMNLPGGLLYTIFPSRRYAAKEFKFRGWIPGDPYPGEELTPWEVTTAISEILAWKEDGQ